MESVFVHRFTTNSAGWILWVPAVVRPINCFSRTCESSVVGTKQSGRNALVTHQHGVWTRSNILIFVGGVGVGSVYGFSCIKHFNLHPTKNGDFSPHERWKLPKFRGNSSCTDPFSSIFHFHEHIDYGILVDGWTNPVWKYSCSQIDSNWIISWGRGWTWRVFQTTTQDIMVGKVISRPESTHSTHSKHAATSAACDRCAASATACRIHRCREDLNPNTGAPFSPLF